MPKCLHLGRPTGSGDDGAGLSEDGPEVGDPRGERVACTVELGLHGALADAHCRRDLGERAVEQIEQHAHLPLLRRESGKHANDIESEAGREGHRKGSMLLDRATLRLLAA